MLCPGSSAAGEENDLPVIEPEDDTQQESRSSVNSGLKNPKRDEIPSLPPAADLHAKKSNTVSKRQKATVTSRPTRRIPVKVRRPSSCTRAAKWQPRAYTPHGAPRVKAELLSERFNEQASQQDSFVSKPPWSYRLSVPPSIKLEPPEPTLRPLPSPPRKNSSESSTAYHPHPAYPKEDWTWSTHSPVRAVRDEMTSSPGKSAGRGRVASWMSVISSAWKHRGLRTPDRAASADSFVAAPRLQR